MKKTILTSIVALGISVVAHAGEWDSYVSAKVGYSNLDSKTSVANYINLAGGSTELINKKLNWSDGSFTTAYAVGATYAFENSAYGKIRGEIELKQYDTVKAKKNPTIISLDAETIGMLGALIDDEETGEILAMIFEDGVTLTSNHAISMENTTVMANFYYDFGTGAKISPYVMAGIGVNKYTHTYDRSFLLKLTDSVVDGYDFVWKVGAGISYQLKSDLAFDFTYNYVDLGKQSSDYARYASVIGSKTQFDSTAHEFSLGIRYQF